jgi:hypothetical protein
MARLNFDPRQVEPNQVFEPVPSSWYTVQIIESDTKPTSNQNGHYLELKVQIIGGDYNGRTVFDRLNLDNPNQQTVDIAYRTLSAICHAVGKGQQEIEDSQMLHAIPLLAKINERPARTDPATGTRYDPTNEVKGYKAIDPTAAPVLGPSKAQQRPFGGAPNGPSGPPTGFPGAGGPASMQSGDRPAFGQAPQGTPPAGWAARPPAANPANAPMQQPNNVASTPQFVPQNNGQPPQQYQQPNPNNTPVNQPTDNITQVQQRPLQQQEPQSNVGNPNLAAGTPPPWAQQQPQTNGNSQQATPPWQK